MKKKLTEEDLNTLIQKNVFIKKETSSNGVLLTEPTLIVDICQILKDNKDIFFDYLSCITAIDNYPKEPTFELVYSIYSIPNQLSLNLYVIISREKPHINSVSKIWKSANWLEREIYDLFGIYFENHPDLRRILLPHDWEGYPLRKDYKPQDRYHGIAIDYKTEE
jgi:NADH-quinone oxidoreductase subunit C